MRTKIHLLGWAAAVVALVACQEKQAPDNPTYNPETNTVNAQFVLNVSPGTGKDTKTTAQYAQVGGSFLGMDAVHMLAYKLDDKNKGTGTAASQGHFFFNPVVEGKPVAAERDFSLGALFGKGEVTSQKSSRTVELAIPLGTNSVSFYAKATKTADGDYQGITNAEGDPADLRTLTFSLESRLTSSKRFEVGAFFFSSMLTYFMTAGLVNENLGQFWHYASGTEDRSYGFWYPIPGKDVTGFPANPKDQDTAEIGGVTYTYYHGQLSWKNLGTMHLYEVVDSLGRNPNTFIKTAGDGTKEAVWYTMTALGDALGEAYYVISSVVKKGSYEELRAGSASAVLRVCEDLFSVIERCCEASPTSWEEECAHQLALQMRTRMKKFFRRYTDGFDFIRDAQGLVNADTLKAVISTTTAKTRWEEIEADFLAEFDVDYFSNIGKGYYGFPQNVGLPYGAAIMQCTPKWGDQADMDEFSYTDEIPAYGMGGATFPIKNYRFPPELMYYGNSSLRVSNSEVPAKDFPGPVAAWSDDTEWDDRWEKNGAVKASTRSVAMKNTINYGTALLRSTVRYPDGLTYLLDNNKELHPGEEDNRVYVNEVGKGFLVTGIVIGGQPHAVGWDYTRYPDSKEQYDDMGWDATDQKYTGLTFANNPFDKMIYDRVVNGYTIGQSTTPIYSMVWDNYDATLPAKKQSDVYIAVELYNNTDKDFWGELNLVRKKGIFYLVGKLNLEEAVKKARETNSNAFSDLSRKDYCYPPFRPDTGETVNAPRVFMQDYVTEATLLLNQDCLKHAYLTVPDLRASQVSLGLSIDLNWEPGLAFTVNMGVLQ